MTTIICITGEEIGTISNNFYDYSGEDRILKNILTGGYEVFYSGQNKGIFDYQLVDAVNNHSEIRVYYRRKKNQAFKYLGSTNDSSIIQERTIATKVDSLPNERLQIRLVIPKNNVSNIQIDTHFEGSGKYKKACLEHSSFTNDRFNLMCGFYTRL